MFAHRRRAKTCSEEDSLLRGNASHEGTSSYERTPNPQPFLVASLRAVVIISPCSYVKRVQNEHPQLQTTGLLINSPCSAPDLRKIRGSRPAGGLQSTPPSGSAQIVRKQAILHGQLSWKISGFKIQVFLHRIFIKYDVRSRP